MPLGFEAGVYSFPPHFLLPTSLLQNETIVLLAQRISTGSTDTTITPASVARAASAPHGVLPIPALVLNSSYYCRHGEQQQLEVPPTAGGSNLLPQTPDYKKAKKEEAKWLRKYNYLR